MDLPPVSPQPCRSPSLASPRRSTGLAARPHLASVATAGSYIGQGVLNVQQVSVANVIEDQLCLALHTPVLQGRPILRVARAQPNVGSLRRSVRLAARPRVPNPTLQAQKVLMVKLGLANASEPIDTAET